MWNGSENVYTNSAYDISFLQYGDSNDWKNERSPLKRNWNVKINVLFNILEAV